MTTSSLPLISTVRSLLLVIRPNWVWQRSAVPYFFNLVESGKRGSTSRVPHGPRGISGPGAQPLGRVKGPSPRPPARAFEANVVPSNYLFVASPGLAKIPSPVQSEVGPQSLDNLSQGENLVGAASAFYWYLHTQYLEIGKFYRFVDLTVSAVI